MKKDKRLKKRNRWFLALLATTCAAIAIQLANLTKLTSQTSPDGFFHTLVTKLQSIPMMPDLANNLPQGQTMIDTYQIEWVYIEVAIAIALVWIMYKRFQYHRKWHQKEEKARFNKDL